MRIINILQEYHTANYWQRKCVFSLALYAQRRKELHKIHEYKSKPQADRRDMHDIQTIAYYVIKKPIGIIVKAKQRWLKGKGVKQRTN